MLALSRLRRLELRALGASRSRTRNMGSVPGAIVRALVLLSVQSWGAATAGDTGKHSR